MANEKLKELIRDNIIWLGLEMEYLVDLRLSYDEADANTATTQTSAQLHRLNKESLEAEIRLAKIEAEDAPSEEQVYTQEEWDDKILEECQATTKADILVYMVDGCTRYGYELSVSEGGELVLKRYN